MNPDVIIKALLENRDTLLGYVLALTRDHDVAEEVFQDIALAILDEVKKGIQVDHFLSWAREIARRRVNEYYRKHSRRMSVEQLSGSMVDIVSEAFAEHSPTAEINQTRQKLLLECLSRLSGKAREVIERRYGNQMSLSEISEALSWKDTSVKVALSRTRKALFACVQSKLRALEAV